MILRPYQVTAIGRVRALFKRGVKRVLLCGPTGFGKTACSAEIIRASIAKGNRVLFVVHRREIILDTANRLNALGIPCGVILSGVKPTEAYVQVASIQTLAARGIVPPANLVIWDECHHVAARTYAALSAHYGASFHLGLTATPVRADGAGLGDAFDDLVIASTVAELQSIGYLSQCDAVCSRENSRSLASNEWDAWHEYAQGRHALIFVKHIARALEVVSNIPGSVAIHQATPKIERADSLKRFAAGDIPAIVNVYTLTEGTDLPIADVAILGKTFGHSAAYMQAVGRVLRGNKQSLIVDLGENVRTHGMPHAEREYSLGKDPMKHKPVTLAICRACGAVRRGIDTNCWRCGADYPAPKVVEVRKRSIERYTGGAISREMTAHKINSLASLRARATANGYKKGWIDNAFRGIFGHFPGY